MAFTSIIDARRLGRTTGAATKKADGKHRRSVRIRRQREKVIFLPETMLRLHRNSFPETFERYCVIAAVGIRALAQRINDHANEWLQPIGLNAAKYNYLVALYFSPQRRLTLNEVSKLIHTSNAAVTAMIDALCADGMVKRLKNPADRRSFIVCLTSKGAKTVARAAPVHCHALQRGFTKISVKDRRELVHLIHLVHEGFETAFEPGPAAIT